MYPLLYKYLILHKKAAIPGIGVFSIKRQPAKFDFSNKIFDAPVFKIDFNPDAGVADNRLYAFISGEQNIDETQAAKKITDFANSIKGSLAINKTLQLPGLGTLSQNKGGIQFQSAKQLQDYFPDLAAERIARVNTEHNILVGENNHSNIEMKEMLATETYKSSSKDYWWMYAIILAVISIAAIIYYYTFKN